jgi:predicted enzyme related to lactoylglutathione lyase
MSETAVQPSPTAEAKAPSVTFGFVKLVVRDLAGAADFYKRALGLHVAQTMDSPVMTEHVLRKPGSDSGPMVMLYHWKDGREITVGNGHGPVGFYVRDVDAAYAYAVGQGGQPHREPFDAGTLRCAFVLDPEGHEIELISVRG